MTVVTKPFVNVRITSSISTFEVQRGFDRGITIAELKVRSLTPCMLFTPETFILSILFVFCSGKIGDDCRRTFLWHGAGAVWCVRWFPAKNG